MHSAELQWRDVWAIIGLQSMLVGAVLVLAAGIGGAVVGGALVAIALSIAAAAWGWATRRGGVHRDQARWLAWRVGSPGALLFVALWALTWPGDPQAGKAPIVVLAPILFGVSFASIGALTLCGLDAAGITDGERR